MRHRRTDTQIQAWQRGPQDLWRFLWTYYRGLTIAAVILGSIILGTFVVSIAYLVGRL